jgi:succinyl-diaminopimelate desuccinylase
MNDYFANALSVLKDWIKIKSVKSKPTKNAPFGKGVSKMLSKALSDAENLGFETKNYDGFIGEVVFGSGNDRDGLAVLCHLDVVPEGDLSLWSVSPYSAVEKDGYLYGRGVVDDKGAAALCLFALKELKDEGFVPSRKIKLILGCDEESGWGCIDHYNEVAVMPKIGFSPDGEFPVTYAEKGIYHIKYYIFLL